LIQKLPAARQARVAALFVSVVGLAACGGGGGGGGGLPPGPPQQPPSTPLNLADCTALPAAGVDHRYLNAAVSGAWGKRVWQAANSLSFPEATHARLDYAAASDAQPAEIWYFKADAATRTTLGFEKVQGGTVTLRDRYEGWVESRALAEGASETIDYTVHRLLPAGASSSERRVRTFTASRETTLPGGRINTCMVDTVRHRSVPSSAPLGEFERERVHYAPGVGVVKRYLTPTHMTYLFDRNQVYFNELVTTNATPTWVAPPATTAPTLAACAAIVTGQTIGVHRQRHDRGGQQRAPHRQQHRSTGPPPWPWGDATR